jgi:hypothetical protein
VWRLAKSITARIEDRIPKDFHPKDEEGSVQTVMRLGDLSMDQGSWTIMARTNSFCQGIADKLEQMGYYYSVKGVPSVGAKLLQNMNTWKTLSLGGTVGLQFVRDLYGAVPKVGDGALVRRGATKLLDAADPEAELGYHDLVTHYGWLGPQNMHVYDVLRVSKDEARYIRALIARGEDLNREPRIKVSTFHAMKGGEDDNCVVYLGSTWSCIETKYPDDEWRALYVAVTRTKENLYLLESDKKYRYYL